MKLQFPNVPVETSADFESQQFELGDIRVIMNLLSSKIYARPKYIIVQEVGSNARDANREAGKPNEPITIKLPNRFDDNFIIADKGIGISPTRMSDVFLKYGNSTKRDSNAQTGGFGIGAKTPFTYTDAFTVVTVTDDEDGRHKRTYIAHKKKDMLHMSLVSTEDTDEPTGTAIGFAVDKKDFSDFEYAVREVCQFWEPRPEIQGHKNWTWPEFRTVQQGDNWKLVDRGSCKVLIDSIPYTLRLDTIYPDRYGKERKLLDHMPLHIEFKTGDIDVSATREDLDYQPRTIQAIKDVVTNVMDELQKKVSSSIAGAQSLWEASIQWQANKGAYRNFVVEPEWQGHKLLSQSVGLERNLDNKKLKIKGIASTVDWIRPGNYLKLTVYEQDDQGVHSKKGGWRSKTIIRQINVRKDVMVVLDDSFKERPNKLRLQTLFDTNPHISEIAVVSLKMADSLEILKYALRWEHIPHTVLSTIPKAKRVSAKTGKAYTVNAVKRLAHASRSWQWQPVKDRAPEDDQGGVYVLLKNGNPVHSNGNHISKDRAHRLAKLLGEKTLYGILYKYRNKISDDWEEVTAKATLEAARLRNLETVKTHIKLGRKQLSAWVEDGVETFLRKNVSKFSDPQLVDLIQKSIQVEAGGPDYDKYSDLMTYNGLQVDKCENGLKKLWDGIKATYPMLEWWHNFDRYSWRMGPSDEKAAMQELIFYLNAKFAATAAGVSDAD